MMSDNVSDDDSFFTISSVGSLNRVYQNTQADAPHDFNTPFPQSPVPTSPPVPILIPRASTGNAVSSLPAGV